MAVGYGGEVGDEDEVTGAGAGYDVKSSCAVGVFI